MKFFDGAFGTYYMAKTGASGFCELANLTDAERVLAIHKEYLRCGVDAVKTNTYSANAENFPDAETLGKVIESGYRLAQKAAEGTNAEVYADIGGVADEDLAEELYRQVADIFLSLGATCFLFETLPGFAGIEAAAKRIKSQARDANIIVSFAVSQDGYSAKGVYYKQLISQADACPFTDAVGLNCTCGPAHLLRLTRGLTNVGKPLSVMPNAGYPATVNGRTVFNDNADYFGEKIFELSKLGVAITGGCCGTTPEHIRRALAAVRKGEKPPAAPKVNASPSTSPAPQGTKLARKPIFVELDPPFNGDDSFLLDSADLLKNCGVAAVTLADSPLARSRADSVLTAAKLKTVKGMDVLPHITCRDKNAIALKGSLLGAYAFGIDKLLIVTGDRPDRDGVFNFNSVKLISYISNLNRELFANRPFNIGGALNVNAVNFDAELGRAEQKINGGASFLLTQPIFSEEAVANFIRARQTLNGKLYAGILPVVGYKNAVFLNNEVAGIKIPESVVESFKDKTTARENAIKLSEATVRAVYGHADGFYIMTPLKKAGLVCSLIERCFDV